MACYNPMQAWQSQSGTIYFLDKTRRATMPARIAPDFRRYLTIPCGQCIGCKLDTAENWTTRCLHEAKTHDSNCFLTLTIDPKIADGSQREKINPLSKTAAQEVATELKGSLNKRTHTLFVKRLRHLTTHQIKFYMCGEYGEQYSKPHYHYLVFGYDFPDRKYLKKSKSGAKLYTSETLNKLWPYGHAWIGDVTSESCGYVARYVTKKLTGEPAKTAYTKYDDEGIPWTIQPEFCLMSRNPGIGSTFYDRYNSDFFPSDQVWIYNKTAKMPRYYSDKLKKTNEELYNQIKKERERKAELHAEDNTPARLDDRERVTRAKLNQRKRDLTC
ncbi:MAG: replication initiator protein [Microvirus sp.]|nr:MAG: replication initiator protein [Microvirus sp.]